MGKFSLYNIPLRSLSEGTHDYNYQVDNRFFELINDADSDLRKGTVEVNLAVERRSDLFELNFVLNGAVQIPCDRCLDDMPIEVEIKNRLIVKFGKEYSEESDEIVIIPEEDGEINVAWFLYEFIALTVPMKRVHPPGKCNKIMSSKLNKHKVTSADDEGEDEDLDEGVLEQDSGDETDSRWDTLKDLEFNSDN